MGYNYYILIQGLESTDPEKKWTDLEYYDNSGTYSSTHRHYFFFSYKNDQYQIVGQTFTKDMGETQYVFSYDTLQSDYQQNVEKYDLILSQSESLRNKLREIS